MRRRFLDAHGDEKRVSYLEWPNLINVQSSSCSSCPVFSDISHVVSQQVKSPGFSYRFMCLFHRLYHSSFKTHLISKGLIQTNSIRFLLVLAKVFMDLLVFNCFFVSVILVYLYSNLRLKEKRGIKRKEMKNRMKKKICMKKQRKSSFQ